MEEIINNILNDLIKKEEIEWYEIIDSLIANKVIDPENIDLNILIDFYINIVKELKNKDNFDFILSSKVLLLLVIFLKIKIEYLSKHYLSYNYEDEEIFFDDTSEEFNKKENKSTNKNKEIKKSLILKLKIERKRKITINDLKESLKEIIKKEENKRKKKRVKKSDELEDLKNLEFDIKTEMEKLLNILNNIEKDYIYFNELLNMKKNNNKDEDNKEKKIKLFIPLLHLDFQNNIELEQNKHFSEILIRKK